MDNFVKTYMVMNITEESVRTYLTEAKGKKVAIIGDVMIDRYFWGKVTRVSPEAPVPVVDIEDETMHSFIFPELKINLLEVFKD